MPDGVETSKKPAVVSMWHAHSEDRSETIVGYYKSRTGTESKVLGSGSYHQVYVLTPDRMVLEQRHGLPCLRASEYPAVAYRLK